jgi:hypothetical protein
MASAFCFALLQYNALCRRYFNNSILEMHIDRIRTHVISGIINIAQKVATDWELLILDHDDNEHRVVMKPGDLLLYESAKNIHGRPGQSSQLS